MRRPTTSPLVIAAEIVSALIRGPRLTRELADMVVSGRNYRSIGRHLDALRASGLVYICEWRQQRPVFAWQGEPFSKQDAKRPPRSAELPLPTKRQTFAHEGCQSH